MTAQYTRRYTIDEALAVLRTEGGETSVALLRRRTHLDARYLDKLLGRSPHVERVGTTGRALLHVDVEDRRWRVRPP